MLARTCRTTRTGAPRSAGRPAAIRLSASTPPADPPNATTGPLAEATAGLVSLPREWETAGERGDAAFARAGSPSAREQRACAIGADHATQRYRHERVTTGAQTRGAPGQLRLVRTA